MAQSVATLTERLIWILQWHLFLPTERTGLPALELCSWRILCVRACVSACVFYRPSEDICRLVLLLLIDYSEHQRRINKPTWSDVAVKPLTLLTIAQLPKWQSQSSEHLYTLTWLWFTHSASVLSLLSATAAGGSAKKRTTVSESVCQLTPSRHPSCTAQPVSIDSAQWWLGGECNKRHIKANI